MPKTITLRLSDETYRKFNSAAVKDNRSISRFTDKSETEEIFANTNLLKKLERGHSHARLKKGKLIG